METVVEVDLDVTTVVVVGCASTHSSNITSHVGDGQVADEKSLHPTS